MQGLIEIAFIAAPTAAPPLVGTSQVPRLWLAMRTILFDG
jgi:hypothetical protein